MIALFRFYHEAHEGSEEKNSNILKSFFVHLRVLCGEYEKRTITHA